MSMSEYSKRQTEELIKMAKDQGREIIIIDPKNCSSISFNPLEQCEEVSREKILAKVKALYVLHLKHDGQKFSLNEFKEICNKNNFGITDDELLEITNDCEDFISRSAKK